VSELKIRDPRDIILAPVVSEKSYGLLDQNTYTFGGKVTSVNTMNRKGKVRRTRTGVGKRPDTKRAIVTVAEGDRIDIFTGPVA